jgi:TM2 domain-containing membrane protein YozV
MVEKNRLILLGLSWIGGGLGFDRFYMAYNNSERASMHMLFGFLKMVTGGMFGIVSSFDFIVICAEIFKQDTGTWFDKNIRFTKESIGPARILSIVALIIFIIVVIKIMIFIYAVYAAMNSIPDATVPPPVNPPRAYRTAMFLLKQKNGNVIV